MKNVKQRNEKIIEKTNFYRTFLTLQNNSRFKKTR